MLIKNLKNRGFFRTKENIEELQFYNKNFLKINGVCTPEVFMAILKDQEIFVKDKFEIEKHSNFVDGKKKFKTSWNTMKRDATGFVNMFSFFRNDYKDENELIFYLVKINNTSDQYPKSLNDLNYYIRNNFFVSDLEKTYFDFNLFFKLFEKFKSDFFAQKNLEKKQDLKNEEPPKEKTNIFSQEEKIEEIIKEKIPVKTQKVTWKIWKNLKKKLKPKKNLSYKLIKNLLQKIPTTTQNNFSMQDDVIVYNKKCQHFHSGQILKKNNGYYMVMLQNTSCSKISKIDPIDIKSIISLQTSKSAQKSQNSKSVNFIKNVDIKALALLIKLLEMKYIYNKTLSELKDVNEVDESNVYDVEYLNKNILIIDKYLKNAMLKLRIRDNSDFNIDDLVNNYIYIVSKIKKEIKKEINDDKKEWIKNELNIILNSLNKKLERKILKDVENEMKESFEKNNILEIYQKNFFEEKEKENGKEENKEICKKVEKEENLENLVKDCLGLLKCMKVEGDVDMDKNGFYIRILKKISCVFPENEVNPKMHNFSNTLIKIIEKLKNHCK